MTVDEFGDPIEKSGPEPEPEESLEVQGMRALHEEMRKTRVAVQWTLLVAIALLVVSLVVAFGGLELKFTTDF